MASGSLQRSSRVRATRPVDVVTGPDGIGFAFLGAAATNDLPHNPAGLNLLRFTFEPNSGFELAPDDPATGFLYVRRELIQGVTPTFAGWASFRGSDDYTQLTSYNPEPWPDARRFELITLPIQDFDAANASLDLLMSVGIGHINAQLAELASPLIDWARQNGAEVTSPSDARRSAITCIRPRGDVRAVYQRLSDSGVVCSLREGSIRFAPHLFNNPAEIEVVVGAMS